MNLEPSLRQAQISSRSKGKATVPQTDNRVKRNVSEKARRDMERYHLERMSFLFEAPRQLWSKKDILSLGENFFLIDGRDRLLTKFVTAVLFLLYGSGPFSPGFVKVHSTAPRV